MSSKGLTARVTMEEKYATLSVSYNSGDEKENLFICNEFAIKKFNISPDIYIKPDKPGQGRVIIEFRENSRLAGEYFEYLIKETKIKIRD